MNYTFVSNFFNHHQHPISDNLYNKLNGSYSFIATTDMDDERKKLGYENIKTDYTFNYKENAELCDQLIDSADAVMYNSAPYSIIRDRLKKQRLLFLYSERIYKILPKWYEMPARAVKYWLLKGRYKNCYLLCASAYTAADYHRTRTFENRSYKWGYFPEKIEYDISALLRDKDKTKILWVGRLLNWKHPDDAVKVARELKEQGYVFSLDIIGDGELKDSLEKMIIEYHLSDCVKVIGSVPSNLVRSYMEKSGIFIFTSDRYEGWGAVLNEAMNSGCAIVASHLIGSVPYLLKNNENGIVYNSGNFNELLKKTKYFLDNPTEQERCGKAAYKTIFEEWNADIAADRLINLSEHIIAGEKSPNLYASGPCSKADIIKDDWYNE